MSGNGRANIDRLLEQLYSHQDADDFYQNLTRIMRSAFTVDEFEVKLTTAKGEELVDWDSIKSKEDTQSFPLELNGDTFGEFKITPPFTRTNPIFFSFLKHVAIAIYVNKTQQEQERLIEESVFHVQALETLGQMLTELDTQLILNRVLKFCMDLIGAEVGVARIFDEVAEIEKVSWGLPDLFLPHLDKLERDGSKIQILELEEDIKGSYSLETIFSVPLPLKGQHRAEMIMISGLEMDMDMIRTQLLDSCVLFGAQALQKALNHVEDVRRQRTAEQLEVAKKIQERLLPDTLPDTEHLQMAGLSIPAQSVGGDYYDVIGLPDGNTLAFVADVSGKGIPAALHMSGLRSLLRSQAQLGKGPSELLETINRFLTDDGTEGSFITACCLVFSQDGKEVSLATAGHEPILYMKGGERFESLEIGEGLPLGLRANEVYLEKSFDLEEGDLLLLYSDGAIDARSEERERFGSDRLKVSLTEKCEEPVEELLGGILEDLDSFRGKEPWADDLTLLAFKCV
jgi:serine phosphatase RsbU (regulator of sigma subunit)